MHGCRPSRSRVGGGARGDYEGRVRKRRVEKVLAVYLLRVSVHDAYKSRYGRILPSGLKYYKYLSEAGNLIDSDR